MIINALSKMMMVEAILLLVPALVGLIYKESSFVYFIYVSIGTLIVSFVFSRVKPITKDIYAREGLIIVALAWILWSLIGAIPFWASGSIPKFIDAMFETISGFTTTGSSILNDIEALPKGMLFWRSMTHWIGGMGVLVFVMVITSLDKKNSMHLMRAEVAGPEAGKIAPKATDASRILYTMYFILTFAEIVFLLFGGMNLFDAIIHSFGTAGTGGFSSRNASIAFYNSAYIETVVAVFMCLFGINFNLYFFIRLKRFKEIFKNEELKVYLSIIAITITAIVINIINMCGGIMKAFRSASFAVISSITTSGFVTADYQKWPMFSKVLILLVMIIGGCAGSTSGGLKVSRVIILFKSVKNYAISLLYPNRVKVVTMNKKKVSDKVVSGVKIYFVIYFSVLIFSLILISLNNFDMGTNLSAVITTLNGVGPGLNKVGPVCNFTVFNSFSKIVLCLNMFMGRLEIFPYLMLFTPVLWKRKF